MKFTINGQEYRVRFSYSFNGHEGGQALQNIRHKRIVTHAKIQKLERIGSDDLGGWTTIAYGEAIRNPMDPFIKGAGRRLALQKALKQAAVVIPRSERQKIWEKYFDLHNDPKPDWYIYHRTPSCDYKQQEKVGLIARILEKARKIALINLPSH